MRRDVGRAAELSALDAALARARTGRGQTVLLVGEAGVGTSHLLRTFLDSHEDEVFVADLTARQGPDSLALAPLAHFAANVARLHESPAVDAAASDLTKAVSGRAKGREIVRLIDEVIRQLSEHDTVAVVLDDAQKASTLLVEATAHIARRSRDRSVITLLATRPDDTRIDAVLSRTDALVLPVDPFDPASAAELVEQITLADGGLDPASVAAIVERAGGNARYLIELTSAHSRERPDGGLPVPTLGLLVLRRVERLSPDALAFVQAAAIADAAPSPRLCALVAGLDPDAGEALDELLREGMIDLDAHGLVVFPNPTVHEAVIASTPRTELRRLHAAMAGLLSLLGADATEVAPHALAAATPGDGSPDDAVALAADAAEIALHTGNPAVALDLVESAVRLGPGVATEARLRTSEGDALLHLGHVDSAATAFERAIALGSGETALLGLARALQRGGRLDAALDAFARCSGLGAVRGRAEVLLGLGRVTEARDAAAAAVAEARRTDETAALASALSDQALVEAVANGPVAVKHAAASVRVWRRAGEDALDWPPLFSLGLALETADRYDECLDTLTELRAWLDSRGLLDQVPRCVRTEVTAAFLGGRWARMEEALAAAIDVRRDEPNHEMGPIWAAYAALAAARGDERGWSRGLERSREALAARTTPFDRALSAWWRSLGHAMRLELREAYTASLEAVDSAISLGAANLVSRSVPGLAMLTGVLGVEPVMDLDAVFRDSAAGGTRPSLPAGELLVTAFTTSDSPRRALIEAAELYSGTENRLGMVLTLACVEFTPGPDAIPTRLGEAAREIAASLSMNDALVAALMGGAPAHAAVRGHLP